MVLGLLRKKTRSTPLNRKRETALVVDGIEMPVQVSENSRARRLTLRIAPGGRSLKVTIPPHVGDQELDEFLARNRNWVAARLSRLPKTVAMAEGAVIPFKGIDHQIIHLDRLRGIVEPKLILGEPSLLVPGEPHAIGRKLLNFLKSEARRELNQAVLTYSKLLDVRPKTVRITDTTSRWGSCSTTRTLSFSWRIIMAPPEVLHYLAAHEVAHLREMNHSDRFWNHVREICPGMETHKAWLRTHGTKLHAIILD